MSISATLVALFDVVILLVVARRARDVLFVLALAREPSASLGRRSAAAITALGETGGSAAAAELARAIVGAEPDDRAIIVEDALAGLRERVVSRLLWLRVMAPAATGLGLVGAAVQASWAQHPPGLLALDPDRVLGVAATEGATCLALGIAGSTTALGALFFLRSRAREILVGAERVAQLGRTLPRGAWTGSAR